jgi:hypothetical protein
MTLSQNETQALIALVTTEWRPLPLNEISAITGKAPTQCGVVFRHLLGLMTESSGGRNAIRGRVYVGDAYGHRFARVYRTSGNRGNGTRYWWRRFPTDATDAEILASALTLTSAAHFAVPPAPLPAPMPSLFRTPEFKPATGLAAEITKAAAEAEKAAQHLERLVNMRDARISQLEAELSSLRAI